MRQCRLFLKHHFVFVLAVAMMPGNPDALAQQFKGEEKRAEQVMETFKQKCIDIGVCIIVLFLQLINSASYIYSKVRDIP